VETKKTEKELETDIQQHKRQLKVEGKGIGRRGLWTVTVKRRRRRETEVCDPGWDLMGARNGKPIAPVSGRQDTEVGSKQTYRPEQGGIETKRSDVSKRKTFDARERTVAYSIQKIQNVKNNRGTRMGEERRRISS